MAKIKKKKKFNRVKDPQNFSVFEPGTFPAIIVASESKKTNAGTGSYLQLEFNITSGENKGRKVWHILNLDNPNEQAEDIAWSDFKAVCLACGFDDFVDDSKQLHKKPLLLGVGIQEKRKVGKGKKAKVYEARNKAVSFAPLDKKSKKKGKKKKATLPWEDKKKSKGKKKGKKGKKE